MDDDLVILDGFHALKHGLRFGAEVVDVMTVRPEVWRIMADELAPDVREAIGRSVREVPVAEFEAVSSHPTGIVGLARRPHYELPPERDPNRLAPAVLLENPRRLGNVGAVIRVAAAARAGGVITTGALDPWQAAAVRGAAGLHYALPVVRVDDAAEVAGPLVVFDPEGESLSPAVFLPGSVLVFGTERQGVTPELKAGAAGVYALPMRPGVSSLNLATSVAAVLYYWRLGLDATK